MAILVPINMQLELPSPILTALESRSKSVCDNTSYRPGTEEHGEPPTHDITDGVKQFEEYNPKDSKRP